MKYWSAQVSILINTQLAALLGDGRISWITYADRLMEFPTARLGVAVGTVLLPTLARHGGEGDETQYSALLDWGLRLTVLLAVPAAVALWLLALPLVSTLYQYGRFGASDALATRVGGALRWGGSAWCTGATVGEGEARPGLLGPALTGGAPSRMAPTPPPGRPSLVAR